MILSELLAAFGMVGSIRCELAGQAVVHELRPPPTPTPEPAPTPTPTPSRTTAEVEQDVRDIFGVTESQSIEQAS
jgi:hypothetical protein